MNRKDAKEIVAGSVQSKDSVLDRAEGFLECDAQWREKINPLVEALERHREAWKGTATESQHVPICAECKALSDFKREVEE